MNINIYLEDQLANALNRLAKESHISRNAIIREAIKDWVNHHQLKNWPQSIQNFKGIKDFSAFESYRDDLLEKDEDPFK